MSQLRSRALLAAGMSASLLAGLAVTGSTGATTPDDTVAETSVAAPPETVAETSFAPVPETAAVEVLPPDETWGGLTRGELDARYWQSALSFPEEINPWFDTTGERCGYGQSGPVFVLVPSDGATRTCVVAEGTAIWVMVANNVCSEDGRDEEELRESCSEAIDGVTDYQAFVNGQEVANLDAYRTASPMFNLTFPENNVWDAEPGVVQAVSEGYSFIIAPPPPGQYEIAWTTKYPGESAPRPMSTVNLVVEAPRVIAPTTT